MTLKQLRGNMKQFEAAENLSISKSYLSLLENGKRGLDIEMAEKLAALYRVNIEQIIKAYKKVKE